jgi:DNA-binding response OmpR family regulator
MSARVLLVDDDRAALFALEQLLTPLHAKLFFAQSGEDALRLILKHDFQAIMLDVRLPGMDGFEVAGAIKALQRSRHIPIIFMSANEDRRRSPRLDSEVYFRKPLNPELVTARMKSLLDQRRTLHAA